MVGVGELGRYLDCMSSNPDEATVPAGRHGLAPGLISDQSRERLIAATVELVAKRGYRETSVDQIAAAAGVGSAVFYSFFEGKEDCFLAAFDRIVEESAAALTLAVADTDGWPEEMATALGFLLDLVIADPRRARVALVEVQAAGPRAYLRYEEVVDRAAPKLREGRAFSRETAALSGTLEEAILGGVIWIVHQRLVKGELDDPDSLLKETIQFGLSPYLGDDEAKRLAVATVRERS